MSQASALSMVASKFFAKRRLRPNQARVRSTQSSVVLGGQYPITGCYVNVISVFRQGWTLAPMAPCSHSQPFDTALQAYSGQAVDRQEATSEPGIRVAEHCLVINHSGICSYPPTQKTAAVKPGG